MAKMNLALAEELLEAEEAARSKAGLPEFKPTDEQRQLVSQMAIAGISRTSMSLMVRWPDSDQPISKTTLEKHFKRELTDGVINANVKVAGSLFKLAMAGNLGAVCFWLKTRAGWREVDRLEVTGADGAPLQGQQHGVLVVPGVMDAKEWSAMILKEQADLMAQAEKHINGEVLENEAVQP